MNKNTILALLTVIGLGLIVWFNYLIDLQMDSYVR